MNSWLNVLTWESARFSSEHLCDWQTWIKEGIVDAIFGGINGIETVRRLEHFVSMAKSPIPFYGTLHVGWVPEEQKILLGRTKECLQAAMDGSLHGVTIHEAYCLEYGINELWEVVREFAKKEEARR